MCDREPVVGEEERLFALPMKCGPAEAEVLAERVHRGPLDRDLADAVRAALGAALVVEDDVTLLAETRQDDVPPLDRAGFLRSEAVELDRQDGAVAKAVRPGAYDLVHRADLAVAVSGLTLRGRPGLLELAQNAEAGVGGPGVPELAVCEISRE